MRSRLRLHWLPVPAEASAQLAGGWSCLTSNCAEKPPPASAGCEAATNTCAALIGGGQSRLRVALAAGGRRCSIASSLPTPIRGETAEPDRAQVGQLLRSAPSASCRRRAQCKSEIRARRLKLCICSVRSSELFAHFLFLLIIIIIFRIMAGLARAQSSGQPNETASRRTLWKSSPPPTCRANKFAVAAGPSCAPAVGLVGTRRANHFARWQLRAQIALHSRQQTAKRLKCPN